MTKAELIAAIEALNIPADAQVVFVTEKKYGEVTATKTVNHVRAVEQGDQTFLEMDS